MPTPAWTTPRYARNGDTHIGFTTIGEGPRTGDAVAIAEYMGKSDSFDRAIADFTEAYEAQNRRDYAAFVAAIDDGRLPVSDNPDDL